MLMTAAILRGTIVFSAAFRGLDAALCCDYSFRFRLPCCTPTGISMYVCMSVAISAWNRSRQLNQNAGTHGSINPQANGLQLRFANRRKPVYVHVGALPIAPS